MISPYKHTNLVPISLIVTEKIDNNLIKINVSTTNQLYSTKYFSVYDSDNTKFDVIYYVDFDGNKYLYSDEADAFATITVSDNLTTHVTFDVTGDNEAMTYIDIVNRFKNLSGYTEISGIEMQSTFALLDSTNQQKLNNLKHRQLTSLFVTDDNTQQTLGCFRKLTSGDTHIFELVSSATKRTIKFELVYSTNNAWSVKLLNSATDSTIELQIYSGLVDSVMYYGINCRLSGNDENSYQVAHYIKSVDELLLGNPMSVLSSIETFSYIDNDAKNFGEVQSLLIFNTYVKEISIFGIQEKTPIDALITKESNLNDYYIDGTYSFDTDDVDDYDDLVNLPDGIVTPFVLNLETISKSVTGYVIKQTLLTIDSLGNQLTFFRLLRNSTNTDWIAVTQSSFWKNPVQNFADLLPAEVGSICYVISENELYKYFGGTWSLLYGNVSETQKGFMSPLMYDEFFLQASQSKRIKTKNTYIHRLSELTIAQKAMIADNVIDLIQRNTLTTVIEEYSIGMGFSSLITGKHSIGFGTNLELSGERSIAIGLTIISEFDNTTGLGEGLIFPEPNFIALGRFNLGIAGNIFEIGNGTEDTERSNVFSITKSGMVLAAGYSIPNGDENHLLLANGTTIHKNDVGQNIQTIVRNEFTFTYDGLGTTFTLPDSIISIEMPVYVNQSPFFSEHVTFDEETCIVSIDPSVLYVNDIVKIYGNNLLNDTLTSKTDLITENTTLSLEHNSKILLVSGSNIAITIPNNLPNDYIVYLDYADDTGKLVNNAGATGNFLLTSGNTHNVATNGQVKVYKTHNQVRVNGNFV